MAEVDLETIGGYDIGSVVVEGDKRCEVTFWNEFMTLDVDGKRAGTFPDLITLLSLTSGLPVGSAEVSRDQEVGILWVPNDHLILGEGVRLPEAIAEAEQAIGKPLLNL